MFSGEAGEDSWGDGGPGGGDGEAEGGRQQQGRAPQAGPDQAQHEDTENQEVRALQMANQQAFIKKQFKASLINLARGVKLTNLDV